MKELRKLIRQVIKEARTKQPGDLSQQELAGLVKYVLTGEGVFGFSEKFAGSHAEILHRSDSGNFSSKTKSGRDAGSGWGEPRGKAEQITKNMSALKTPSSSRRFGFEFIDAVSRPDYINYLIGDQPAAIEYTGELTAAEADLLNQAQSEMRFVSRDEISRDSFDFTSEEVKSLEEIQAKLETQKLKRADIKDYGSLISTIITGAVDGSLLGGPIEGLMVQTPETTFKMPNPSYSAVQRLQSPLYAMFSGRGGVSKREIKSRLLTIDPSDRLIKDIGKYLDAVTDLPPGFRTFFTPEESENLLNLLDSAVAGEDGAGESLYAQLNKRINSQSDWINT